MAKFNAEQQNELLELSESLSSSGISYVVLRGHQELPESVPGVDIDVFANPAEYEKMKILLYKKGFKPEFELVSHIKSLLLEASKNPVNSVNTLVRDPRRVFSILFRSKKESGSLRGQFREYKSEKIGINIHIQNHLAYRSPRNQKK